jgi:hypothetical protein
MRFTIDVAGASICAGFAQARAVRAALRFGKPLPTGDSNRLHPKSGDPQSGAGWSLT